MNIIIARYQVDRALPDLPWGIPTGSAVPVVVHDPTRAIGYTPTLVKCAITNADGVKIEIPLTRAADGKWRGKFAAANFTSYGFVRRGVQVTAAAEDGQTQVIYFADLEVKAASPEAVPADPTSAYQVKGDDEFHKSELVEGVQHYKKVVIAYDEEMGDWGFKLEGDYILAGNEFVPAN